MMNKKKLLVNINSIEEMAKYKEIGITNFLFAVKDLSIGYNDFSLDSIPYDSYILINRVMDTEGINKVKELKEELIKYRGIIYEDVGVFNIFKDSNIDLIWFQNHFTTNYNSINYWLKSGCKSALISNEITKEEIKDILDKSIKPLVLNVFGKNQIMYSRRTLLSNFNKYNELDDNHEMVLDVNNNNCVFLAKECEYGTAIFNNEYFNYIDYANTLDDANILYYLIMNLDLNIDEVINVINGYKLGNDGFLNKKTVYKMSEYTDRGMKHE